MITVIAIGKKHEDWIIPGVERYEKRLRKPYDVKWVLLPHSSLEGRGARQEESERILSRINPSDYVVLLDETGKMLNSPGLTSLLEQSFAHSRDVAFVIGGAYGVDDTVKVRADRIWSLSDLVFPHQLVRLLLMEQIYRAEQIAKGTGYHHI